MRARSRWVSTPANGEFCRSSHPLSDAMSSPRAAHRQDHRGVAPTHLNQRAATPRGCAAVSGGGSPEHDAGSALDRSRAASPRLVEPKAADLVPGELAGRLFSLLEPQDVDETDSAVRSDRRVPQLPAVAEVDDVLPG